MKPRIAVVGGGIGGLAAAYHLREAAEVTLFEREPVAGGHARTIIVDGTPLDCGFIVFNETTYPGFSALLRELDVQTQPSDMSFGVRCDRCALEWSTRGLRGFLAQPRSLLRPSHLGLLAEITRFHRDARRLLSSGAGEAVSLGEYADRRGGRALASHVLVPLAAAVWSAPPGAARALPFARLVQFLDNHGMIGWGRNLQWRTIQGGSHVYVDRLLAAVRDSGGRVRTGVDVEALERPGGRVYIHLGDGGLEHFDAAVLATHADDALRLIRDPDREESEALASFAYSENEVVLHTDARLLPRAAGARASWNYVTGDCRSQSESLTLSYHLNRLQDLEDDEDYVVSVNPGAAVDPTQVVERFSFRHPLMDAGAVAGQRRLAQISGRRGTAYAGAHLGHGFHEDGYQAGRRAAAAALASPRHDIAAAAGGD